MPPLPLRPCLLLLPPLPLPPCLLLLSQLSLPRVVLSWVLQRLLSLPKPLLMLLLPHVGTIPGLALFHPLPHILGQPGGPHLPNGPGPLAQESPLVPGPESASHHLLRAPLEISLWTCPQPRSSGDPTSTITIFQEMLTAVRGICIARFIIISRPLPLILSSEIRCD